MTCNSIQLSRVWAMPSKHTFTIRPIKEMVESYVKPGQLWIDPYAGFNSPVEESNDINPAAPTKHHMEALDFVRQYQDIDGVLFDPPYSPRQIHEAYKLIGRKCSEQDTQHAARLADVKNAVCLRMKPGAIAISCGWNSNGFGEARGFQRVSVLLVSHGAAHNDTIVTVEVKQ